MAVSIRVKLTDPVYVGIQFWGSSKNPGHVGVAVETACCPCTCWFFYDDFDRADSTDLGANWHEEVGDWGISGMVCVEKYGTSEGTANAKLITTAEEPLSSAGEQFLQIEVTDHVTGDVYRLYPACTDIHTPGPCVAEFTCTNAPALWTVTVGSESVDMVANVVNGWVTLNCCVDNNIGMAKAWVAATPGERVWNDSCSIGAGRFSGFGHNNTGHINVFDNYYVTELNTEAGLNCYDCFCRCGSYAPDKTLTITLVADVTSPNRADCVNGATGAMTWEWNNGDPRWVGSVTATGSNGIPWTRTFHLRCSTEDPDDPLWYPGKNFTLYHVPSDSCCNSNLALCQASVATSNSTCSPNFSLEFGPFCITSLQLECYQCYNPGSGPSSGCYTAVITP